MKESAPCIYGGQILLFATKAVGSLIFTVGRFLIVVLKMGRLK